MGENLEARRKSTLNHGEITQKGVQCADGDRLALTEVLTSMWAELSLDDTR